MHTCRDGTLKKGLWNASSFESPDKEHNQKSGGRGHLLRITKTLCAHQRRSPSAHGNKYRILAHLPSCPCSATHTWYGLAHPPHPLSLHDWRRHSFCFWPGLRLYCSLHTTDAREKMSRDALISKRLVAKYDVVLKLTHWLVRPSPLISQLFGFPDWIISTGVCLRTVLCHLADKEL